MLTYSIKDLSLPCVYVGNSEDWSFESFVKSLNQQLKHLDMQIVNNRMEDSNERWYGLVNRCVDPGAKIAAQCSAAELEFFNKVVSSESFLFCHGISTRLHSIYSV